MKRKAARKMLITLGILLAVVALFFTDYVSFGRTPSGERLERCRRSPNYHSGMFVNLEPTKMMTDTGKKQGMASVLWKFLTGSKKGLKPDSLMDAVPIDTAAVATAISEKQDRVIWFGHSSYLLITQGLTILVDPVLYRGSPVSFINRPFKGTNIYRAEDFPKIDYLVITHDHYDHLDCKAVKKLRHKVGKVIAPLGVGSHLEYWGYRTDSIVELDWGEVYSDRIPATRFAKDALPGSSAGCVSSGNFPANETLPSSNVTGGISFNCTPARHFSGRTFKRNKTLWASFVVQTPEKCFFIGGDGGYGRHFKEIGEKFCIDWAFIENGQYNQRWAQIHTMPEQLRNVMEDLGAKHYITVHHSKFALAQHNWEEPLVNERKAAENSGKNLLILQIGKLTELQ